MTHEELLEKIRKDPAEALDLIIDLVNQYCDSVQSKSNPKSTKFEDEVIGHCFMSSLELAFDFLGLDGYECTRKDLWNLNKPSSEVTQQGTSEEE